MLGRTPDNINAIRPLKDGVIADFEWTQKCSTFYQQSESETLLANPNVIVCVPCKSTLVERRAIRERLNQQAQTKRYWRAYGSCDWRRITRAWSQRFDGGGGYWGGTTEIAVIALSGCVYADSIRIGGDVFDEGLLRMSAAPTAVWLVKPRLNASKPSRDGYWRSWKPLEVEVRGRSMAEGVPKSFVVTSAEIQKAF